MTTSGLSTERISAITDSAWWSSLGNITQHPNPGIPSKVPISIHCIIEISQLSHARQVLTSTKMKALTRYYHQYSRFLAKLSRRGHAAGKERFTLLVFFRLTFFGYCPTLLVFVKGLG